MVLIKCDHGPNVHHIQLVQSTSAINLVQVWQSKNHPEHHQNNIKRLPTYSGPVVAKVNRNTGKKVIIKLNNKLNNKPMNRCPVMYE